MQTLKGVYCLTSPSGKRYVGVGLGLGGIADRWRKYRGKPSGIKKQTRLSGALLKYGADSFKFEVILETDDIEKALNVERQLIALWNLTNSKYGYNILTGSNQTRDEFMAVRNKLSRANKGKPGARREVSAATKAKISKAHKGRKMPQTYLEAMRRRIQHERDNPEMYADKKRLIREKRAATIAAKGPLVITEEMRNRLRSISKGRKRSPETIERMRIAAFNRAKNKPVSEETRAKMRASSAIRVKTRQRVKGKFVADKLCSQ
jgi:group I intron endonuclease